MNVKALTEAIKEKLRAKGITYARLAKGIGVSESTVKRMFRESSEITLGRLQDICGFLGLSLADLLDREISTVEELRPDQEEYLASHPETLQVLYGSVTHGDVTRLARGAGQKLRSVEKALREMEKVGLVERGIGNRVRCRFRRLPHWSPKGPLTRAFFAEMRKSLIDSDFQGFLEHQTCRYYLVSPESAEVIRKKLLALLLELEELSKIDLRFSRERVIPLAAYLAIRPHVPGFFKNTHYPSQEALERFLAHPAS